MAKKSGIWLDKQQLFDCDAHLHFGTLTSHVEWNLDFAVKVATECVNTTKLARECAFKSLLLLLNAPETHDALIKCNIICILLDSLNASNRTDCLLILQCVSKICTATSVSSFCNIKWMNTLANTLCANIDDIDICTIIMKILKQAISKSNDVVATGAIDMIPKILNKHPNRTKFLLLTAEIIKVIWKHEKTKSSTCGSAVSIWFNYISGCDNAKVHEQCREGLVPVIFDMPLRWVSQIISGSCVPFHVKKFNVNVKTECVLFLISLLKEAPRQFRIQSFINERVVKHLGDLWTSELIGIEQKDEGVDNFVRTTCTFFEILCNKSPIVACALLSYALQVWQYPCTKSARILHRSVDLLVKSNNEVILRMVSCSDIKQIIDSDKKHQF